MALIITHLLNYIMAVLSLYLCIAWVCWVLNKFRGVTLYKTRPYGHSLVYTGSHRTLYCNKRGYLMGHHPYKKKIEHVDIMGPTFEDGRK